MRTIKFKIILSLLLAVLSWGTSNAQTAFTFKGKIGNYPVVMELYGYISGVEGDMYYVSQGKNKKLYLKGETINALTVRCWFGRYTKPSMVNTMVLTMLNGTLLLVALKILSANTPIPKARHSR